MVSDPVDKRARIWKESGTTLLTAPPEILADIIGHLQYDEDAIDALRTTCRAMHEAVCEFHRYLVCRLDRGRTKHLRGLRNVRELKVTISEAYATTPRPEYRTWVGARLKEHCAVERLVINNLPHGGWYELHFLQAETVPKTLQSLEISGTTPEMGYDADDLRWCFNAIAEHCPSFHTLSLVYVPGIDSLLAALDRVKFPSLRTFACRLSDGDVDGVVSFVRKHPELREFTCKPDQVACHVVAKMLREGLCHGHLESLTLDVNEGYEGLPVSDQYKDLVSAIAATVEANRESLRHIEIYMDCDVETYDGTRPALPEALEVQQAIARCTKLETLWLCAWSLPRDVLADFIQAMSVQPRLRRFGFQPFCQTQEDPEYGGESIDLRPLHSKPTLVSLVVTVALDEASKRSLLEAIVSCKARLKTLGLNFIRADIDDSWLTAFSGHPLKYLRVRARSCNAANESTAAAWARFISATVWPRTVIVPMGGLSVEVFRALVSAVTIQHRQRLLDSKAYFSHTGIALADIRPYYVALRQSFPRGSVELDDEGDIGIEFDSGKEPVSAPTGLLPGPRPDFKSTNSEGDGEDDGDDDDDDDDDVECDLYGDDWKTATGPFSDNFGTFSYANGGYSYDPDAMEWPDYFGRVRGISLRDARRRLKLARKRAQRQQQADPPKEDPIDPKASS
eukprot:TRINITY_DN3262_c0_g1_i6.p1 TRINITY_DN3262_c0_g1~~TRINITY_DN3262_c0_g1_i6.p1  ORF type:complete len:679 (+),score=75.03 TRINITY_DN3262_c0_g1_i6:131-2167(+)